MFVKRGGGWIGQWWKNDIQCHSGDPRWWDNGGRMIFNVISATPDDGTMVEEWYSMSFRRPQMMGQWWKNDIQCHSSDPRWWDNGGRMIFNVIPATPDDGTMVEEWYSMSFRRPQMMEKVREEEEETWRWLDHHPHVRHWTSRTLRTFEATPYYYGSDLEFHST